MKQATDNRGRYEGWWDWTDWAARHPLDMKQVRAMKVAELPSFARPGFKIRMFRTREELFCAMALGYISAWKRAKPGKRVAACGPVGPVEQMALIAQIVNELEPDIKWGEFLAMDEFVCDDGSDFNDEHPLSFKKCNLDTWYHRISQAYRMSESNLHFPCASNIKLYHEIWMDPDLEVDTTFGGQGNTKHIAFHDPRRRKGKWARRPPTAEEMANIGASLVDLHPATIIQDARHSTNGDESLIPRRAVSVGLYEILNRSNRIVIVHPGWHDNPTGYCLTTYMISKEIADGRVPMSCLTMHKNVEFWFLQPNLQDPGIDVH